MKLKNPIAKALRSPHLAPKRVANKKIYNRKGRQANRTDAQSIF